MLKIITEFIGLATALIALYIFFGEKGTKVSDPPDKPVVIEQSVPINPEIPINILPSEPPTQVINEDEPLTVFTDDIFEGMTLDNTLQSAKK